VFLRQVPVKVWVALVQWVVRFYWVPKKAAEKVWEALVQAGRVQQGSGEGSGEAPLEINIFWMLLVSTRYGYFNLFYTFFYMFILFSYGEL
jgi:hypothetical protein